MRFSIEAEQSIIGGLLLDSSRVDDVLEVISWEDFYRQDHQQIFKAIQALSTEGRVVDTITVSEAMHMAGELERCGGLGYLVEIANNTPSTANILAYCQIISDRAMERKFSRAGVAISEIGGNEQIPLDEKINMVHSEFANLERSDVDGIENFNELIKAEVQEIDKKFRGDSEQGLKIGIEALDLRFGGIESDDLVVLAARPSMGKTALAMSFALNVARAGGGVLFFSLEMGRQQVMKRFLSASASISYQKIRDGKLEQEDWPKLSSGVQHLKDLPIYIDERAALDVNRAMATARKYARKGNLKLIVVDYLQLMTCKSKTRFDEVSEISRKLKAMAKVTKCPVIALSQLSRKVEERKPPIPNNADLRESGQIEQDADIIMFIYRDEVYNPDSWEKGTAQIHITKFRNGETGIDRIASKLEFSRFESMPKGWAAPINQYQEESKKWKNAANERGFKGRKERDE